MSAKTLSVNSLPIPTWLETTRSTPLDYACFEELEGQGLRAARGITAGVLFSLPAWVALGTLCYLVF